VGYPHSCIPYPAGRRVTVLDYGERDTLPKLKIDASGDPRLLPAGEAAGGSPFKSQRRRGTPGGRIHA
jgi:hypothetical protein